MDSRQELIVEGVVNEDVNPEQVPADDPMRPVAEKRAAKILKKNKRELERLQKHAAECLYSLNREGYIYAIGKIRTIIRQPLSHEALGALYDTSVERLIELANEAIASQK